MAIQTTAGNTVKFLGLSKALRGKLLKAIICGGSAGNSVSINTTSSCYIGLSSTNPDESVTEPTDPNYRRILLSKYTTKYESDYITISEDGTSAINSGMQKEIKFNRSTQAWSGTFKYFFLADSATGTTNIMAYGELTNPITITAKDIGPLFEEDKFRIYFPAPDEVETLVDAAATADTE